MLENKLKDVKAKIVAGVAALAVGVGIGGCMSHPRVPVYGPHGEIHASPSCFSLLSCTGDSYPKWGDYEIDGEVVYRTCYCYDPTPPPPPRRSNECHGSRCK